MSQKDSKAKAARETLKSDNAETDDKFDFSREVEPAADDTFLQKLFQRIHETKHDEPRVPRKLRSKTLLKGTARLGAGGLGTVYEFWDADLERAVALKVAKRRVMDSPVRLQRFLREREVTAQLQHPAIPPVYQSGTLADGRPYYLMRLIRGKSLQASIGVLPGDSRNDFRKNEELGLLLDAFMDVCDAVQYAHAEGIMHRDIKPANIMLQPDGQAFLVDWGLAKAEKRVDAEYAKLPAEDKDHAGASEDSLDLTMDGQRLGSPDWMSPEQAKGQHHLHGVTTDIYGLGATLYHILAGRAPHASEEGKSESTPERIARVATSDPPLAKEVCPAVPSELSAICRKAMHRDRDQRYQSALELKNDLRRWQQRELVDAHAQEYTSFQKAEHFIGKHQRSILVSLGILVVAAVGSLWMSVVVKQSANAAEVALASEKRSNEQLFSSLEKYADTIMAAEALSAPELKELRDKILADLADQYELWADRSEGTPDELIRAARGSIGLARIEEQTGSSKRAKEHAQRGVELARKAIDLKQAPTAGDITMLFEAQNLFIQMSGDTDLDRAFEDAKRLRKSMSKTEFPQLSVEQLLDEQADVEHLQVKLAYSKSSKAPTSDQRLKWLKVGLKHASNTEELRSSLVKLDGGSEQSRIFERKLDLVRALNAKGLMVHKCSSAADALGIYQQALGLLDELSKEAPDNIEVDKVEIMVLFNAIMSHTQTGDFEGGRVAATRGIEVAQKLCERIPLVIRYHVELARGYGNLSDVLLSQYLRSQDPKVMSELLKYSRAAAETYLKTYERYPDRADARGAAAVHYLRLSAYLHRSGSDAEALTEFRRCLSLRPKPELLEPTHRPNAYAAATGYALIIASDNPAKPSEHPAAKRLEEVTRVFSPMMDSSDIYREMFLEDKLFRDLRDIECIQALRAKLEKLPRESK